VAALLVFGVAPVAVLLHRTADPTNLAAMWVCAGLAVAGGGIRRPGAAIVAAGYLVLGVLTAPVVLVLLVPLAAGLAVSGGRGRPGPWRIAAAGAGVAGYGVLVALAANGILPGTAASAALPAITGLDRTLIVAALVGAVLALPVRTLRPLGAGLLGVGVAALIAQQARLPLTILALPLAALLLPALGDAGANLGRAWLAERSQRAGRLGRALVVAPVAVAAVTATALIAVWVPAAGAATRTTTSVDRSVDRARDWVLTSLPTRPRLAVDDAVWAELIEAGYPAEQLVAVGGLGNRGDGPRSWSDCLFVLGRDTALLTADPSDQARQARERSTLVAGWGVGTERVNARRVLVDPATVLTQGVRDARARTQAGAALASNDRLKLAPEAVALLRGGLVDSRILAVLAAISAMHTLEISTFPAVDGEDDRLPRRQVAVSVIDGQAVTPGATNADLLDRWLAAQQPPFRPAGTAITPLLDGTALLIRYDVLGQAGLLPS
jgi:hypothetical protein